MNRKKVLIVIGVLLFITSLGSVFFFVKDVVGFDIFNGGKQDCVPYNIFVNKGTEEYSVDISWSTSANCLGFVQYGKDRNNLENVGVDLENSASSKKHLVNMGKLLSLEKYFFIINSNSQSYGVNGTSIEFSLENL